MSTIAQEYGLQECGLGADRLATNWGWLGSLGLVMSLAGVFALGEAPQVTLASVTFIGAALQVSGIFQMIHAAANSGGGAFLIALLCGALYVVGGFLVMQEPLLQGSMVITILLLVVLAAGGGLRIALALRHRNISGWWLLLLGGLISIALAVTLFVALPWSGLWVLGPLVGIELLVQGVGWVSIGFALRAALRVRRRPVAATAASL